MTIDSGPRRVDTPAPMRRLLEEITSVAIQGIAAAASIAGLTVLVLRAWPRESALPLVGSLVYGGSLIAAFVASTLYHGTSYAPLKRIFRAVDHATIFLLIAGTYTPISLIVLWHHDGWLLLATIWTLAVVGAALRLVAGPRFHRISVPLYLAMGWLGMPWSQTVYQTLGLKAVLLFLAGGLAYTGGLVFYRWERLPFSNSLWHLCVVAGSVCFFLAISLYVLPAAI